MKTPIPGLFVTGTDTGVGKTVVACALARAWTTSGIPMAVRKPIESGCTRRGDDLYPADGDALAGAAGYVETLDAITPWRYELAISPERAARLAGREVSLAEVTEAVGEHPPGHLPLVEGAGGFLSPLTQDGLNADLAEALGYPVLLVVGDRLGCINHALLTAEAIAARGLSMPAVVVNAFEPGTPSAMDNAEDLRARLDVPVCQFAFDGDETTAGEIADHLLGAGQRRAL